MLLGVDTGGTFTDFVLLAESGQGLQLRTHKVLSTPDAPARAILQGISELGLEQAVSAGQVRIIHGSTVATNAALEGKGVRTAFITNHGFRDLLTIARQTRPHLYRLETPAAPPPVPEALCLETGGRLDSDGKLLEPLQQEDLERLGQELQQLAPRAVAITLLFSFLDDRLEVTLETYLREVLGTEVFISRSSGVLPEYREYERGIATWLNASLGPLVQDYLLELRRATRPAPLSVMQSSGGTIIAEQAADRAVNLLLSGPAGGLAAACHIGQHTGETRLMTFDMGGTSTDVALINGKIQLSTEGSIGAYPVAIPMVDMHTIGAGGGSIACMDSGGLLQVGPRSAGASPGPACYGLGGLLPTVTDANLILGRLPASASLAGSLRLAPEAARRAVKILAESLGLGVEETALGIVNLANEHMARALRVISVEKGFNPADFRLCCFGGAGGLHICQLADALGMQRAMVPVHAGVLSALGMLVAPVERQLSRTHQRLMSALDLVQLDRIIAELSQTGVEELKQEGIAAESVEKQVSLDLRYQGQSTWLNIPWSNPDAATEAFHAEHARRYGHALPVAVELVNVRVGLRAPGAEHGLVQVPELPEPAASGHHTLYGHTGPVPAYARESLGAGRILRGPALITETSSTIYLDFGWTATVDDIGNLRLEKTDSPLSTGGP